ncbi:MAG TPA: M67 family metallopeptidase [Puia sp.]|jgi:proteasome lid subunit RPN8/RPN11|nr:M67 family metallopeptidase [Puia sp.]
MILIDTIPFAELKSESVHIFPDECCGFLFGTEQTDGTRIISKIWVVDNVKPGDKRRRFEISSKDYMQAEREALENDVLLLGIYHSHPNHPAIPSEHDRVAAQPWFSYLIISVIQGQFDHIRSWRLNETSQFEEENISFVHLNQTA